jgi:sulfofructosephosphate aldolase
VTAAPGSITRDLSRIARPGGGFAMLAVDQREAMRSMFAEHQQAPVTDEQLRDFKVAATRVLTPHASAVLVDRQFALDAVIEAGAVAPGCGLIAAADRFVPGEAVPGAYEHVMDVELDDDVDLAAYRDRGVVAAKLLVIYRPGDDPGRRRDLVRRFLERSHAAGLVSILEPVSRAPRTGASWDWDDGVLAAARELGGLGADLYKAEVPLRGTGDHQEIGRRCGLLSEAVSGPWVVLSSGVPHEQFPAAVQTACRHGASGFLAGRAVWASVIGSADVEHELATVSVERLERLAEIVDATVNR